MVENPGRDVKTSPRVIVHRESDLRLPEVSSGQKREAATCGLDESANAKETKKRRLNEE